MATATNEALSAIQRSEQFLRDQNGLTAERCVSHPSVEICAKGFERGDTVASSCRICGAMIPTQLAVDPNKDSGSSPPPEAHPRGVVTATVLEYAAGRRENDTGKWADALDHLANIAMKPDVAGGVFLVANPRVKFVGARTSPLDYENFSALGHDAWYTKSHLKLILLELLAPYAELPAKELVELADAGKFRYIHRAAAADLKNLVGRELRRVGSPAHRVVDLNEAITPAVHQRVLEIEEIARVGLHALIEHKERTKIPKKLVLSLETYFRLLVADPGTGFSGIVDRVAELRGIDKKTVYRHLEKIQTFFSKGDPLLYAIANAIDMLFVFDPPNKPVRSRRSPTLSAQENEKPTRTNMKWAAGAA
jgi:hypothetical protein